jgi:ureidoacrylate peracid hydrolase
MLPDASSTALIVVDMQVGFLRDGASCDRVGLPVAALKPALEPCRALVAMARAKGVPIIYTRYVYRADYRDGGLLAGELIPALREHRSLAAGSVDADIVEELAPQPGDYVLDKNRPSSFYGTPLETWLNGLGVENLVVCGVTTNCCVESTVRDASHRDYRCFVVRDAVAEFDEDRHRVALDSMAMLFGYVINLDELRAAWGVA